MNKRSVIKTTLHYAIDLAKSCESKESLIECLELDIDLINQGGDIEPFKENIDERLYGLAITTCFSEEDVRDFMAVTGCSIDDTERHIRQLYHGGVSRMYDVLKVVKLGFTNFTKEEDQ